MKTAIGRFRTNENVLKGADAVLKPLGISRSTAIDLFLRQVVLQRGLPFEVKIPNKATREAIEELESGGGEHFASVEELFASWEDKG